MSFLLCCGLLFRLQANQICSCRHACWTCTWINNAGFCVSTHCSAWPQWRDSDPRSITSSSNQSCCQAQPPAPMHLCHFGFVDLMTSFCPPHKSHDKLQCSSLSACSSLRWTEKYPLLFSPLWWFVYSQPCLLVLSNWTRHIYQKQDFTLGPFGLKAWLTGFSVWRELHGVGWALKNNVVSSA